MLTWLSRLPANRAATRLLVAVNGLGTLYGFYWYRAQLAATPPVYWPVIPDSPGASLLFTLLLLSLLAGRRRPALAAFAYLSMIKYGLWTVLVMGHLWFVGGVVPFDSVYLSLSHLGMAVEAWLYLRAYRPRLPWALAAAAWLLFNDYMDYVHGFHPVLPEPAIEPLVATWAVGLTLLALGAFVLAARGRPVARVQPVDGNGGA
ncbi:MAG: DUF1405 domain-containing protein [Clostridia bacterium]|nr:DUF1405 domain-containing protein [Clostridia bacterium]